MINLRAKNILEEEYFKISALGRGAERIKEGLKMGVSEKMPSSSAGLRLPGSAAACSCYEENKSTSICPLFLNPFFYPEVRTAEVQEQLTGQ